MEGTAIDKPDDSRVEAQPVPPPSIRAWLANYRLWVADDERERSFASDEILAVRLRFAHDDQYLVILVSSVDEPIVGVAGFDSARSIAKALDRGVPPEGAELVFGEPPPFVDLGSLPDVATLSDPFAAIPFVTVDALPGRKVVTALGTVVGSTVRTRHIGAKFVAGARDVVGGEFRGFTRLLDEARREAIARMLAQAKDLGADAVVGFRLATSEIFDGSAEVLAYGTAVSTAPTEAGPTASRDTTVA